MGQTCGATATCGKIPDDAERQLGQRLGAALAEQKKRYEELVNELEDTKVMAESCQEELEVERRRAALAEEMNQRGVSQLEELQNEYRALERVLAEEIAKAEARIQVERQMAMRMEDKVAAEHRRIAQVEDGLMEERRKMQRQLAEDIGRMEAKLHVERQIAMRMEDKIAQEQRRVALAESNLQRQGANSTSCLAIDGQPADSSGKGLLEVNCTKVSEGHQEEGACNGAK